METQEKGATMEEERDGESWPRCEGVGRVNVSTRGNEMEAYRAFYIYIGRDI